MIRQITMMTRFLAIDINWELYQRVQINIEPKRVNIGVGPSWHEGSVQKKQSPVFTFGVELSSFGFRVFSRLSGFRLVAPLSGCIIRAGSCNQ
ncbi:hypothetical protein F0562_012291 [Nyssa sinensis]|uniref:Uncharacterized protein n=1 Tax=Nyssa sinensis TaxID=561372 RepID=A0A5J4ZV89_9ASTE|nr:hypothetical protein F0562_012291 [Nyssa sinensis]